MSVSDPKKAKPTTSVKSSRNTSHSTSSSKSSTPLLQAPSLFDDDDCLINTDETHDESGTTNSGMENAASTDDASKQNVTSIVTLQTVFPLALAVQNSSVSDGVPLSHAAEEKAEEKSEDGNLSGDDLKPNPDVSDEARPEI